MLSVTLVPHLGWVQAQCVPGDPNQRCCLSATNPCQVLFGLLDVCQSGAHHCLSFLQRMRACYMLLG